MIRHRNPTGRSHSQQRGAVLVISLLILLVMTLIGITGMQTSVLEERMAGNYRDTALAFQAAETALRDAETRISADHGLYGQLFGVPASPGQCSEGLCNASEPAGLAAQWEDLVELSDPAGLGTDTEASTLTQVVTQPEYWIERFPVSPAGYPELLQYRITALGYGMHEHTRVVLQSIYRPEHL
jgi:type IV pilus assembly protein PilX